MKQPVTGSDNKKYLYCPRYAAIVRTNDDGQQLVGRARCKQWSCPYCSVVNRRQWQARIANEVKARPGESWHFWTLTLDGKDHDGNAANSLIVWRRSWDAFWKGVRRKVAVSGKKLRYLRVFETHKDGTLHVHLLANATFPDVVLVPARHKRERERYESDTLRELLEHHKFGPIHDVRPLANDNKKYPDSNDAIFIAAYLAKYLTKDIQQNVRSAIRDAGLQRVRMLQTSQGWAKLDNQGTRSWEVGPISEWLAASIWRNGGDILDVNTGHTLEAVDFQNWQYYPNFDTVLLDEYAANLY